jgi:hypothetical protein
MHTLVCFNMTVGVKDNPDFDLDDVMERVLDLRYARLSQGDYDRAEKLKLRFLSCAWKHTTRDVTRTKLKIKKHDAVRWQKNADHPYIVLSPLQFASYFGEHHVVQVLVSMDESDAIPAFLEAAREGYTTIHISRCR